MAEDATMEGASVGPTRAHHGGVKASQHAKAQPQEHPNQERKQALKHLQRLNTLFDRHAALSSIRTEATALLEAVTAITKPQEPTNHISSPNRNRKPILQSTNNTTPNQTQQPEAITMPMIQEMMRKEIRTALSELAPQKALTQLPSQTTQKRQTHQPPINKAPVTVSNSNTSKTRNGPQITPNASYATIVATATTNPQRTTLHQRKQKSTPTVRKDRQINIHGKHITADMTKATPEQMVIAVNHFNGGGCMAANILQPSADIRLIFHPKARQVFLNNTNWVKDIFGSLKALKTPTVTVLAKGIPRGFEEELNTIAEEISQTNNVNIFRARNKSLGREKYTTGLLLEFTTPQEANRLIESGLLWRNGFYVCEPYFGEARPSLCYTCWGYGHTSKVCGKTKRCPSCAGRDHGPDTSCPVQRGLKTPRCATCRGNHSARQTRTCPIAIKEWANAKALYKHRPKLFSVPEQATTVQQPSQTTATSTPPSSQPTPKITHSPDTQPTTEPTTSLSQQTELESSPVQIIKTFTPHSLMDEDEDSDEEERVPSSLPIPKRKLGKRTLGRPSGITKAAKEPAQQRLTSLGIRMTSTDPQIIASSRSIEEEQATITPAPSSFFTPLPEHD